MVINKSIEEGIVVLLMLALQEGHTPVGSQTLSTVMAVSDSYLKKTLRKLVVSGLVHSSPGRDGGFTLARPINAITVGDAFRALDPEGLAFKNSGLAHTVFTSCDQLPQRECQLADIFAQGCASFAAILDEHPLSELLNEHAWDVGACDWATMAQAQQRQAEAPEESAPNQ